MSKLDKVVNKKYGLNSKFKFRCHKDIKCFTKCCSNVDILLTPYDVLRLKKRLKLTSSEFLLEYTYVKTDEQSSHPHAMLKMKESGGRECPFLTPEGCTVYADRPANCRYYPVGQGTLKKETEKGIEEEEFYFFVNEPHCLGFNEDKEWSIESWRIDQEVDLYDRLNREWKGIQLRKNLPGQPPLDEKKQLQFYIASYDLDGFRNYVFESRFLEIFDIDKETLEKIRNDEVELMQFGFKYIKYIMMLEETLKARDEAVAAGLQKNKTGKILN